MPLFSHASSTALDTVTQNAMSIIIGLDNFIERHTGDVSDSGDGVFALNTAGIILNNMHYEVALSGYMPNGTATTEGQSLLIMGYIYVYKATGDKRWLDKAEYFWDAYHKHFYQSGDYIPPTPTSWRCHWAINGKAPFRTLGPVNYASPSQSGAWDVPVQFNDGVGYLPQGEPYYCEKVARLYRVYSGLALWNSVTSEPADGGVTVPFKYFIDDRGLQLIDNGDNLNETPSGEPTGKIVLDGAYANFTGTLNTQFACRTGHIIGRNQAFEGWPMWSHVDKSEFGNAADAETWFCEASYLLYGVTGNKKYLKAFESSLYTLWQNSNLPDQTLLFARRPNATTPYTEGISFGWNVCHNADAFIGRDSDGYIHIEKTEELYIEDNSQVAIEQSALINRVNENSALSIQYLNPADFSKQPIPKWNTFIQMAESVQANAPTITYRHPLLPTGGVMRTTVLPLSEFVGYSDAAGNEYVMLNGQTFVEYGNASVSGRYSYGILGDSRRNDYTGIATVPDSSSGVVVGFWGASPSMRPLRGITYRYLAGAGQMIFTVRDANNWKWEYTLPPVTDWTTINIEWAMLRLSKSQDNTGIPPQRPFITLALTQFQLQLLNDTPSSVELYCYGDVPDFFVGEHYMVHFKLMIVDHYDFVAKVGDVNTLYTLPLIQKYVPGLIPFSTNYSRTKGETEYWRGTPNTGYQYPSIWMIAGKTDGWMNVVDYFYDAQQDYFAKKGLLGPMAPIYIWPRYDNLIYGDQMNTFSYYDWGSHTPWGGYYSRAFYAMCRLYQCAKEMGETVPEKLTTVIHNQCTWLADFMRTHDGLTPTIFPVDGLPENDGWNANPDLSSPDHTGHMTAHWLSGAVMLAMNGFNHPDLDYMIDCCAREFEQTYVVTQGKSEHMSGSFSPWVGGNMYYGFWTGEILRGLAFLMMYQDWKTRGPASAPADLTAQIEQEDTTDLIMTEDGLVLLFDNPVVADDFGPALDLEDATGSVAVEDNLETDSNHYVIELE